MPILQSEMKPHSCFYVAEGLQCRSSALICRGSWDPGAIYRLLVQVDDNAVGGGRRNRAGPLGIDAYLRERLSEEAPG